MSNVYLHLGSNEGNRQQMLESSISLLEEKLGKVVQKSSIYETESWGKKDQDDFLNQAIEINTDEKPLHILEIIKKIELDLGSVKTEKWGSRKIDIDILFYDDLVIDSDELQIPHSMMEKRNFVLIPMLEIAEDLIHPILEKTIFELYDECRDECEVRIFNFLN